ncbi:uncharacterized protein LOC107613254 [Arachis ipaensis]|uniref:uncharacterized protein LOC107613254 n=1 Tax=Arachis ipaensis TaxID=130454 RepID=UPI0007AF7700|nr:uncharacterized protein LOC107613254 [Arachis ipaensis]
MGKLHYFLGIQVIRTSDGGLLMTQSKYVKDLLAKAGMSGCKSCSTPLPSSLKIQATGGPEFENPHLYRSVVGSLQILRYVSGSATFGLKLHKDPSMKLTAYCDSDWAGDPSDRKSIRGFCVYMGRNLVSWQSKKQGVVARSSTEAEYRALADLVAELVWIKSLLGELKWPVHEAPMAYCDNQSDVLLAANPILHSKAKHFEIDLHFVRDHVTSKTVQVSHVPSTVQIADTLTKALPSSAFLDLRNKLNVQNLPNSAPLSLRGHDTRNGDEDT